MAGPLEGIRVVELGVWVAGPAAGGILADWGADVIKIEPDRRRVRACGRTCGPDHRSAITGYGLSGPDADRAAYDVAAYWARAGLAHLLTRPGETPPFQRGGMGDHTAGMTLAAAVCAALVARGRTGAGQLVSTSLYRQGAYTVSFDLNTFLMTGHAIAIGQRESMGNPCMNNYVAGDGGRFWIVGLQVDRHWDPLCRVVGRPDWSTDYPRPRERAANARHLIAELDEIFATKPLDEWANLFATEPDFFWSPINSIEDVVADEQFHAAGGIVYVPDDDTSVPMIATPVDFHGTPWEPRSTAPALGQHTEEVLDKLKSADR